MYDLSVAFKSDIQVTYPSYSVAHVCFKPGYRFFYICDGKYKAICGKRTNIKILNNNTPIKGIDP